MDVTADGGVLGDRDGMRAMNKVAIDTLVSRTGRVPNWRENLISIRAMAYAELPSRINSAALLEGMIEFRVDGTVFLGKDLAGFGYVDSYWRDALTFVASLMELRSAEWPLCGKQVRLWLERSTGTRRGELRLEIRHSVHAAVAVHVPTLAEELLRGAAEYFTWLPRTQRGDADADLERLRAMVSAWRHADNR